jgi:hypothetical protein
MATRSASWRPRSLVCWAAVVMIACVTLGGCSRWIGGSSLPMDGARAVQPQLSDAKRKALLKQADNDPFPSARKAGL